MANIAIVGAGVIGVASAAFLQRDGHSVTLYDPLPPGEGCSFGNAGSIGPGSVVPLSTPGIVRQAASWITDPDSRHRQINPKVTGSGHTRGMTPTPPFPLCRPPLPGRDHQPCGLAVLPVSAELAHVEEMLAARGITVSYETVRQWGLKFGQSFANQIRRRLPRAGDKWHLDEVAIKIAGKKHWLWRAVDQDGVVLDVLVQSRRKACGQAPAAEAAEEAGMAPRLLITDKLRSYGAAKREIMPGVEHRQHKGLNNRAENSHQPTRRRERR